MGHSSELVSATIKAYDVRGVVGEQITEELVRDVGASFARLVRDKATEIVIGHDMRDSSPALSRAFGEGAQSQGLNVVHIGLASTDQLYYASGKFDCPGAMFTASHNPAKYNGIKMCYAGAKPVGQDTGLRAISAEIIEGVPAYDGEPGTSREVNVLSDYAEFIREQVDLSGLRHLKVAVDAGNGMGGYTVPEVLGPLDMEIVPLYFELDGSFPNHEANPLDPKNLVDLQKLTVECGADIGIAFDGDADRCFVVDEKGDPVSPSAITALVAERELAKEPGATIIHNLITSHAVPEIVTELGGKVVRTRVGHSFIKQQMAETGAVFGGEHSAHYYFRDFWGADSGMLAAMHVLSALGEKEQKLSDLGAKYERYVASGEINSTVDDAKARTEAVRAAFADRTVSTDELDGLTVELGNGTWFNLRASNTEPLLRLNAESPSKQATDDLVKEILSIVRG
ncbi:phosphomannomutase/phosphoglucomutase [Smaragdicoccus niigatensis]|uniref:phosphomannomutase/phosphoglucomutase n=1 Tax=Smaragdicoccus niigatensis TaxID=359359 RepID=UPI00037CC8EF|nr:phosphomannomutase/phosphoglucomutase [Smaragdicoccus niigatensis]